MSQNKKIIIVCLYFKILIPIIDSMSKRNFTLDKKFYQKIKKRGKK